MSAKPTEFSDLSPDIQDLFAIYKNLRHELVLLTAAGPLMERREKFSKLDNGERRGHEEGTQVREHIRMFFKLRDILIEAGLPLEIAFCQTEEEPAAKSAAKPAKPPARNVEPLIVTPKQASFNPGTKSPPAPNQAPEKANYATSLSSTMPSPTRTTPVFSTHA